LATLPTRYSLKLANASTIDDNMPRFRRKGELKQKVEVTPRVGNLFKGPGIPLPE